MRRGGGTSTSAYPSDASADAGAQSLAEFLEQGPAIELAEPKWMRTSICPGVQMLEVARRHTAAPDDAAVMPSVYFGVDDLNRRWTMRDIFLCELHVLRWVEEGTPEGNNMASWHGPWVLESDQECIWREPFRTEEVKRDGGIIARTLHFRHKCRRGGKGPFVVDRPGTFTLYGDYRTMELTVGEM